ncbi:sarcosine oxidase subunit beta [Actinophytocola xinjiangensis]|uniref:Sarcosine oxidase subunit beta n=1 Tax=Actinophytocola xinjiangensis TaxID=485602 RepID=A0A7Z1AX27_9PSEU|nr:FAD-binding oxidoreductase [Actinophytocola xinjiangensis]OLF09655.1 sarcosine oxidase subunit beta [Actinophytocola xinjiangensis]
MAVPSSAEVVIVGGGVIGTSIAFHLAEAGVRDVILVERGQLGSGSTCKAAGGVRAQFSDALNIQLGVRSLAAYHRFDTYPGQSIDLRTPGYLFLLSRPEDVAAFETSVALQNDLGVPSRMLEPAEAKRLSPLIDTDGLLAAAYSPEDGYCTPESVVLGYATGARRSGATLLTGCQVLGIDVDGGRIQAVRTTGSTIRTSTVVCAAGAWSSSVGEMVGTPLPVTPYRRQLAFTEPVASDVPVPMTIDLASAFYFRREGRGLMLGMSDPDEPPGFRLERSDEWLGKLAEATTRRVPALLGTGITGGWAGLYEVTPDHNALIGESPDVGRFLYATGFSGHGFMQGPAVGEIVRDLVLGTRPFVDVRPLDARRFDRAELRMEKNYV